MDFPALEGVPEILNPAKVVFISKVLKKVYTEKKFFWAISVTSFIFKTMERIEDLLGGNFNKFAFHPN